MSADGHLAIDTQLDIRAVAGRIGAEVAGVRLSDDLPTEAPWSTVHLTPASAA